MAKGHDCMDCKYKEPPRLSFSQWIDKVFWTLLVGISSFGVIQIKDMSVKIKEVSEKLAVVVSELGYHDKTLQRHEETIKSLQGRGRGYN